MTFKEFLNVNEKFNHPNWGGDRRRGISDMIKVYSPKASKQFSGVKKFDYKHKKSQISLYHK
jgi:hypothetical protein